MDELASGDRPGSCPDLATLEALLDGSGIDAHRDHVDACPTCQALLDELRSDRDLLGRLRRTGVAEGGLRAHPLADVVPGYAILDEIHRGGQGVVYRATQLATNRTVALKVLGAGTFASDRQRQRFDREAELAAGLRHPNIVTVHDRGEIPAGPAWFAMELIEGTTLEQYVVGDHGADREHLLEVFEKVCAAVAAAHQRGVIHRDLKPANILVDERSEPHVADFGLAKPIEPDRARATVTVEGGFIGTLLYAAPEQARGEIERVDVRSDVYALGVILYEMMTGALPHPAGGSWADMVERLCSVQPTPPRAVVESRHRVDADLETIILRCLALDPDRRYPSVEDVRRDIGHYRAGEPIDARRDSRRYVIMKTIGRHRAAVAVAAAFLLLLAGFAIAMTIVARRAVSEAEKLNAVNIFLEDTLGSVQPGPGEDVVTLEAMLDEGVLWIDLVMGDQPEAEASVRSMMGNGYRNIGRLDRAEALLTQVLEARRARLGDDHVLVAKSMSALGHVFRDQGRLDEAAAMHEAALDIRRRRLGMRRPATAMSVANLAHVRRRQGDLDAADALLREALAIRVAAFGDDHADTAQARFSLAGLALERGAEADAETLYRKVLTTRRRLLAEAHPDRSRIELALGDLLVRRGDHAAAEPYLREAARLRTSALPAGHRDRADAEAALGLCLHRRRATAEAVELLAAALSSLEAAGVGASDRATAVREALGK